MKVRLCDKCGKEIKGEFIKCCKSQIVNKNQKLVHIGDLCMDCYGVKK